MSNTHISEQGDAFANEEHNNSYLAEGRELTNTFRRLLVTFLETPREQNEEARLFSERMLELKNAIHASPFSMNDGLVQNYLSNYAIELLGIEKVQLCSIMFHQIPDMHNLVADNAEYKAGAKYALIGQIKYGEFEDACFDAENILPEFYQSQDFKEALTYRLEEELEHYDYNLSKEKIAFVEEFLATLEKQETGITGTKEEVFLAAQDSAKDAVLKSLPMNPLYDLVRQFDLVPFLHEKGAQEAICDSLLELFEEGDIHNTLVAVINFPLTQETVLRLKQAAHKAVCGEKAKIAAGYRDSLTKEEIQVLYQLPINEIIERFGLKQDLMEPTFSKFAA